MRSRRLPWLVAIVVVLIAAVVYFGVPETSTTTTTQSTVTPQPEYGFTWVGRSDGQQFSDDEIRQLANGYSYVVIAKFHADFNVADQEQDARRIKAINPNTKVLMYYSASYWFDRSEYGASFDDNQLGLKDDSGQPMRFKQSKKEGGVADWVDLSNPAYRAFALKVIQQWMKPGGFDGVAFDAAHPIGANLPMAGDRSTLWSSVLSSQQIAAYNSGLDSLLQQTKQALGPNRMVLYNGVPQGSDLMPTRNLGLLQYTDGASNERFCVGYDGSINDVRADIQLLQTAAQEKKKVLQKVNAKSKSGTDQLGRFCYSAFLLGAQPGSSYFKMGTDYSQAEFHTNPAVTALAIGDPTGEPVWDGDVGRRNFTNGEVFSNLGTSATTVTVDRPLQTVSSDGKVTELEAGQKVTLKGEDGLVLVVPPSR